MKNGLLAKLFGAAVLSVGLIALAGTKAMAATETENNGTVSTANVVPVNEAISGSISTTDDVDWYKFTLAEPGSVSLTLWHDNCGDTNRGWYFWLYGGDEREIEYAYWYISGGDEKAAETTTYNVPAGTYYIKSAKAYDWRDCEYRVTVNYESSVGKNMEQESNDVSSKANVISVNTEYAARLSRDNDTDWYKFTIDQPGSISLRLWHDNCSNTNRGWYFWLYGGDEQERQYTNWWISGGDEKASETTTYNVPAGTYYIKTAKAYDWRDCEYRVTVNYESSVGKNMEQETNDTPSTANLISVNKNYSGRVSLEKDLDWYAFDLTESSTVTVTLSHDVIDSSNRYWIVRVYDNAEMTNELLNCYWVGNKEKQTTETEIKAGAGRYYMVVEKYNWSDANYNVCVNTTPAGKKTMLRLYNPNSGEHFYTASEREKNALVKQGWNFEGKAWEAPEFSNTPVYRLYNKNSGDHHYTPSKKERDNLVKQGWKDEGIGWYSDDNKTKPLYRLYNPNAVAGSHHYTTSARERDNLVKQGWKDENIGWYGL